MSIELSSLNGATGFEVFGPSGSDLSGSSIASGDFNGDGFDDILIGASLANVGGSTPGAAFLVFGSSSAFGASLDLTALNGSNGFRLNGETSGGLAGTTVGFADVNDDGFDDILIGAPGMSPNGASSGAAYVVFGGSGAQSATIELSALNGMTGFQISGEAASDNFGWVISSAGDINGDGVEDLIVGAPYADGGGGTDSGRSYIIFGSTTAFASTIEASALDGANGFVLDGGASDDLSGQAVSSAGDFNGDGIDDLLIGATGIAGVGGAYILYGKTSAFSATVELTDLDGTDGFKLTGQSALDLAGYSAASIGDVNGDGFNDITIGAIGADPSGRASAGKAYVIFGTANGFGGNLLLSSLNGSNGFAIAGAANQDELGISVSGAGDVNGDGVDDILVGAFFANPGGRADAGQTYLIFGGPFGFPSTLDLANLKPWQGFALNGVDSDDRSGTSVSTGDIDNDGFNDLLIGAPRSDPLGRSSAGSTYVVFGGPAIGAAAPTASHDLIVGGTGPDPLDGLAGNDRIRGRQGADTLLGGAGNDTLEGGTAADNLNGGPGADTASYVEATGAVTVRLDTGLGTGNIAQGDELTSIENLFGGRFDDKLFGDSGANRLSGWSGNDSLSGLGGEDRLFGNSGNDTLRGGPGADSLSGAAGADTASYSDAASGVTVRLNTGVGTGDIAQGDTLVGIEHLIGGGFGDSLFGSNAGNRLSGGNGNDSLSGLLGGDTLLGGGGNDTIRGGGGADLLSGAGGFDTATYSDAAGAVMVSLDGVAGSGDIAQGDSLVGVEGLIGGDQSDRLFGSDSSNKLSGGLGNDTLSGRSGDDTLLGGGGGDALFGGSGDDSMSGAAGDDSLFGGSGNDTLSGGGGDDLFEFTMGLGNDRIINFEAGPGIADVIRLVGLGTAFDSFAEILAASTQVGSDTVIDFGGGHSITLVGIMKASLDSDDFTFG